MKRLLQAIPRFVGAIHYRVLTYGLFLSAAILYAYKHSLKIPWAEVPFIILAPVFYLPTRLYFDYGIYVALVQVVTMVAFYVALQENTNTFKKFVDEVVDRAQTTEKIATDAVIRAQKEVIEKNKEIEELRRSQPLFNKRKKS